MKVGDLVRIRGERALWLVLDTISGDTFVVSLKTNYKMWASKKAFEVVNESR